MKNNYLYNWVVIVFMMLQMLAFTSCSDDDDNSGWPTETDKTEIFIERFSTLVTNLTALRDGATYGELKDNYPVSSKAMLDDEIVTAPTASTVITSTTCEITSQGGYTQEDASNTAALIRGGALPISLNEVTSELLFFLKASR